MLKMFSEDGTRVVLSGPTMGTRYAVHLRSDVARADELHSLAHQIFTLIDTQMSPWKPHSDLNRINAAPVGTTLQLPRPVTDVIATGLRLSLLTQGAFDIGVLAQKNAWGFGPARDHPEAQAIAEIAPLVRASQALELDEETCRLTKHAPIEIDLCALAKGYALDCVEAAMRARDVQNGVVELDGEVKAWGTPSENKNWHIALEAPVAGRRDITDVLEGYQGAVATSGDYRHRRAFEGGSVSHLIDPRTGKPAQSDLTAVTVFHDFATEADGWATALMVMGAEKARTIAGRFGIEAILTCHSGEKIFL